MEDVLEYFGEYNGLTPELYVKYIIFLTMFVCMCRLVGELINACK